MATPRRLWLGFGALTALLILSVLAIAARLSYIGQAVVAASDARVRVDTVLELEVHFARYVLAVREGLAGRPGAAATAEREAAMFDAAQARYERIARTESQNDIAKRLDAAWSALRSSAAVLPAPESGASPDGAMTRFAATRRELKTLLEDEILAEAHESFEMQRVTAGAALRNVFRFTLTVLVLGALLAIVTSIAVGRGVLRDQRIIAEHSERLRTTLASIGDGVITTDADGRVTNLNPVAESLTGWATGDAAGLPLPDVFRIVNERSREPVENPAKRALRDGRTIRLANHTVLIAKDQTERAIDDSAAPIRCAEGEIVGAVLVFRDVTERREAAAAVRRSERELSEFFENASVPIHWLAPDGTVVRVNPRELQMLGYEEHEYLGRKITELYGDQPEIEEMLARLERGETVWEQPARVRRRDSVILDVLVDASPVFEDGALVRTSWFTRDVTELKLAQQAQARLAAIVRSSDDAIVGKSLEGVVQSWNTGAERIFGYAAEEAVGRHISFLIPLDRAKEEDEILAQIRAGMAIDHFESVRRRKDGSAVHVALTISPIRDETGRVVGASKIARDITLQKRAEQELRESEQRFRALADSAPMLIWMSGVDGKRTWFSKVWLDFVGRPMEQELGDGWTQNLHPDDAKRVMASYASSLERREPFQMEYRLRRHDGEYRWMIDRAAPRFASEGAFLGYLGSCADIDDRVLADQAVRRKQTALETIHRVNLSLAGDLNLDSLIQSVTDAATAVTRARFGAFFYNVLDAQGERYMLYSLSGAPREAFEELGLPRKTDVFRPTFEGKGAVRSDDITKEPHYGRMEPHRGMPEGHLPVRSYLAVPVVSRSGEVHGGLFFAHPDPGVFDDQDEHIVTGIAAQAAIAIDNARLYEQLSGSEERFRVLSETIPAIVWACHPDGRVFYVNRAWTELTGQPLEESLGTGWAAAMHPDDRARFLDDWKRSTASGDLYEGEVRYRRRDGQYRWHFFRGKPVRDSAGAITAWHGASLDVQEQKSAEEALRDADRRKDDFLATLSHELRNPLTPISVGLEVLKAFPNDPEKLEEIRAMMQRQSRQLVRLVDDLLDVSRITRGKLELRRSTVKLDEIIASATEASQVYVDKGAHALEISMPEEPIWVNADPNRLAQVLSNLVINAAKYTPDGGRIRLSVACEGQRGLSLSVADSGIGIPKEMLSRIFEMFTQVEGSSQPGSSGLGIGLTLVQSLVQMHGGSVQAYSVGPNQGSEFRLLLPIVVEPPQSAAEAQAPRQAPPVRRKRRVLIVDDNRPAAEMLGMIVEMLGNEVRTAHDGSEALEIGARYLPEIILMDLGMPNLDGYEAARQIRLRDWGASAMLVALTGWDQEEHRKRTKEAGFDRHLVKPGEMADLEKLFVELEERQS